jgi:5'-phosphate synthase pdxT subunit
MLIGVLALQGSFSLHCKMFSDINVQSVEIRRPEQLDEIDGLIIPGGESTTLSLLIEEYNFTNKLFEVAKASMPIWGTCAGAIILGHGDDISETGMELIGIKVLRNGYGRQIDSFVAPLKVTGMMGAYSGVFIRAPRLIAVDSEVTIMATHKGQAVMAREGNIMVTTFHPELTEDTRIHQYFLKELFSSKWKRRNMNI